MREIEDKVDRAGCERAVHRPRWRRVRIANVEALRHPTASRRRSVLRVAASPGHALRTRRLFPVGAAEAALAHIEVIHRGRCSADASGITRRRG